MKLPKDAGAAGVKQQAYGERIISTETDTSRLGVGVFSRDRGLAAPLAFRRNTRESNRPKDRPVSAPHWILGERSIHRDDCGGAWPLAFRAELARAHIEYGRELGESGDAARAAQQHEKAAKLGLDAREDEGFPQSGLPNAIVQASVSRANLFASEGDTDAETAELDVACDVITRVLAAPESDWLMSHGTYAIALQRRGALHMMAAEYAQGLERFRAAVDLRERAASDIAAMDEEDARFLEDVLSPESLMAEHNDCARAADALEDKEASFASYGAAIAIGEELGVSLALPFIGELGMAYRGRAVLHQGAGRVDEALIDCERALEAWLDLETQLQGDAPEWTARDIAITRQFREELALKRH